MSVPSPLPSTDPRAAAGSLALQVAASMIPVPLPWLYVAMGVGCAVFVHSEVDMCGKRKRHLARTRALAKQKSGTEQQQHQQQEQERDGCWVSRWCSPQSPSSSSSSSANANANAPQHPQPETSPADQFCLVRTIQGCLNHRRSRQDIGAANETWSVAQQPTTVASSSSSSSIATSRLLPTSAPRTADEADEEVASAVLPQASHLSSAMDHLRFKLDSLLVWKRSFQSHLEECMPPATDPDAPACSASSTAAAAGVAANVADLRI